MRLTHVVQEDQLTGQFQLSTLRWTVANIHFFQFAAARFFYPQVRNFQHAETADSNASEDPGSQ